MTLRDLSKYADKLQNSEKMPALFLGHGSPMNAIQDNEFVQGFRNVASEIKNPAAILCISAHWETTGTKLTAKESPITIHDFYGFPRELFEVQYPAPGSPYLAEEAKELVKKTKLHLDHNWGLDHGAWSVIKHMYPDANIPIVQMSIDKTKNPRFHYELAKELSSLRNKGVLIVGSGNIVHNLREVAWDKLNDNYGYDWAIDANDRMVKYILEDNHEALVNYTSQGIEFKLSIPTPEHYLPLLYTLGMKDADDEISIFNNNCVGGSLSMTSIKVS